MPPNPPIHTDASKRARCGLLARVSGTRWAPRAANVRFGFNAEAQRLDRLYALGSDDTIAISGGYPWVDSWTRVCP
jgi:hypothetical protein